MARYRIHRIRETQLEHFRWVAHTGGTAVVKPKDYEPEREVEATTPYAAWNALRSENEPLRPGDLLETLREDGSAGELHILKYIGFEPAKWFIPEPRPEFKETSQGPNEIAAVAAPEQSA